MLKGLKTYIAVLITSAIGVMLTIDPSQFVPPGPALIVVSAVFAILRFYTNSPDKLREWITSIFPSA